MPITMAELAKRAGVSVATVSLVISDHPRISPRTKTRVLQIMEELNYVPNSIARGLVNQSLRTIGVVMSLGQDQALRHPYIFEMLSGMELGLRQGGYQLLLHHWDVWNQSPKELIALWEQKRVDGFILQLSEPLKNHLGGMKNRGVPFILIGDPGIEDSVNWVEADNEEAGGLAWASMKSAGFKNPGFVGYQGDGIHKERAAGFVAAGRQAGLEPDHFLVSPGISPEEIQRIALPDCDALACGNHNLALALYGQGRGILTFDNLPYMEYLRPALAAIDIDVFGLGRRAAEGLVQMLDHPDLIIQEKLHLSRFIPRDSLRPR